MAKEDSKNKLGVPTPVKLFESDDTELDTLSEKTGLPKQALIRLCVRAGVELMVKAGYKITLPLEFNSNDTNRIDPLLEDQAKRKGRR